MTELRDLRRGELRRGAATRRAQRTGCRPCCWPARAAVATGVCARSLRAPSAYLISPLVAQLQVFSPTRRARHQLCVVAPERRSSSRAAPVCAAQGRACKLPPTAARRRLGGKGFGVGGTACALPAALLHSEDLWVRLRAALAPVRRPNRAGGCVFGGWGQEGQGERLARNKRPGSLQKLAIVPL